MTKQKEIVATKCSELEAANVDLTQEIEKYHTLNETSKKYLQDAQVDLLSAGVESFERAKAQALCISPNLDVSRMDFFKVLVERKIVYMEEASPEAESLKDMMVHNLASEAQAGEHEI